MWLFRSGLVLLVYAIINLYTGVRLLGFFRYFFPSLRAFVFWPVFLAFCYATVLVYLLRLDRIPFFRQTAMFPLPALGYFFLGLLLLDGALLVLRLSGKIPLSPGFRPAGTGIVIGLTVLVLVYGILHVRDIRTVYYEITLKKDASGPPVQVDGQTPVFCRIALISDLHIGAMVDRKWLSKIVDRVLEANADIICLAGDIFDNNLDTMPDREGMTAELRRLKAPLGVYACPGNHDVDRLSFREPGTLDRIQEFLKNADIILLQDEVECIDERFYLAGRRDARPIGSSQGRKSAAELTAGLDRSMPFIFLDHQPVDFLQEEAAGADLILSGHTHRGQFFPGNIATAYIYKKAGGVHYGRWQGTSAQAVVSSGAGSWGIPFRVATNSEVAVIDLRFGK